MTKQEQRIVIAGLQGIQSIDSKDWWGWDFNGIEMVGDMPTMIKVPDYFNNINACHELINCMEEKGWECVLSTQCENGKRSCSFINDKGGSIKVVKDSFEESICESYLRANGKWKD